MKTQVAIQKERLSANRVIRETFGSIKKVWVPLLTIFLPVFSLNLMIFFSTPDSGFLLYSLDYLLINLVWGIAIFYTHQNLTGSRVSVSYSVKKSLPQALNLLLGSCLFSLIISLTLSSPAIVFLAIPSLHFGLNAVTFFLVIFFVTLGLYLSLRLSFFCHFIAIEDCSGIEGMSRSWKLTEGHWWFVFRVYLSVSILWLIGAYVLFTGTLILLFGLHLVALMFSILGVIPATFPTSIPTSIEVQSGDPFWRILSPLYLFFVIASVITYSHLKQS